MTKKSIQWATVGLLLGFCVPFFSLVYHSHYLYVSLLTPVTFALFGAVVGNIHDMLNQSKQSLETLVTTLRSQSMTDGLTGLFNHRHLLEEIGKEIERARRHGRPICGLMVDVDRFKRVNDRYGHLAGDTVLAELARLLSQSIRKVDVIGRYGGDEFMVLLPETGPDAARGVAERLKERVRGHAFEFPDRTPLRLTLSIGMAFVEQTADLDVMAFVDRCDKAMFKAKNTGRDRLENA